MKSGPLFWIVTTLLLLFLGMAVWTQYKTKDAADMRPFWDRNPGLEHTDSYPNTSLVMARERQSGQTAMLDLFVVSSAQVEVVSCEESGAFPQASLFPGATDVVCFAIHKPDTGAGTAFAYGASFLAKAKDSEVGQFFRDLFNRRGLAWGYMQNSSEAVILQAENRRRNTVARVSIRGTFDTARAFFAVTDDFHRGAR
jgi:hypothetical protein